MLKPIDLQKLNIEEILDSYGLKYTVNGQHNANFSCPFHNDSNPSCGIHVETGMWKCFGCGLSGNLVMFVAEIEHITNKEAEEKIRKVWINKIPDIGSLQKVVNDILDKGKNTVQVDPRFPDWILNKYTKDWTYLKGRGFTDETLEHFNIVYEPEMKLQGIPVRDEVGKLVGINGRNTQGQEPRYFPVMRFRKSNFLFNLFAIDKTKPVIAVEGELNCMAMWQKGFKNTIAFMGAGVSEHQINVAKYSGIQELILFFDTDHAGKIGTMKVWRDLWPYMKIKDVADHEGDPVEMSETTIKTIVDNASFISII